MPGWLDQMAPLLLDAFVASAVLTSVFSVILLLSLQPARRVALARTAIVGTLAIIPLTFFAPWPRFHLAHPTKCSGFLHHFFTRRVPKSSAKPADRLDAEASTTLSSVDGTTSADESGECDSFVPCAWPIRFVVASYLAIAGLCLAWECISYMGIWWLLRTSDPPSERTLQVFNSLRNESETNPRCFDRVDVRISGYVSRPVLVALVRPTILLPLHFDSVDVCDALGIELPSMELLRLSLLHELAHAKRHDPTFQLLGGISQSLWFCMPQLRWIRAQLRIDQEFMADHAASRAYGGSSRYAASLLDLAVAHTRQRAEMPDIRQRASRGARAGVAAMSEAASSLGQRLRMLVECPFRLESNAPAAWLWTLRAIGLATTVILADISVDLPDIWRVSAALRTGERPFHVNDIIVPPAAIQTTGGRLPQHFRMTVDVRASSSKLGRIRLLHLPLAPVVPTSDSPHPRVDDPTVARASDMSSDSVLWHKVRIERDGHGLSLSVDQHPVPCPSQLSDSSITVESTLDAPVELHDLTVTPTS